jgi:uncharacterized glyoxalase superfamily protein PhnB
MSLDLVAMIGVADVARSVKFYSTALAFEVLNTYEIEGRPYEIEGRLIWAFLHTGSARLMVAQQEQVPDPDRLERDVVLYFYPDDVKTLHASLHAKGYEVGPLNETFYGMTEFRWQDPDGYELCFGQELPATN